MGNIWDPQGDNFRSRSAVRWWVVANIVLKIGDPEDFCQAYQPQANGRSEVAGKTAKGSLRKLAVDYKDMNRV